MSGVCPCKETILAGTLDNPAYDDTDYAQLVDSEGGATFGLPIQHTPNGAALGLLVEPQRTNLITQSEDFTDSAWTSVNNDLALDETGPDGVTNSAATLVDDSSTGTGSVYIQTNPDVTVATSTNAYCLNLRKSRST